MSNEVKRTNNSSNYSTFKKNNSNYKNNNDKRGNYKDKNFYKKPNNKKFNNNFKEVAVNSLKLMALGGMGEIGENCYVFEHKNDIFIIDYGVLFPSEEHIGVDYIIPNFQYLKKNEHKIKGLYVTHAHEDHIGGIPFLLKNVKIPKIYAPKFAKLLIEKKLKEHKLSYDNLIEIDANTLLKEGEVLIHTYHQTHSVPNSLGFFFETPLGNIATTGDFKIDFSPSGEEQTDFHKIANLSKKGVLCLISDSTNSLKDGFSESSTEIGENLKLLIKEAKGRIMFTTFASHINRVEKIVEGCLENNRKVCVLGRSMKNNLQIGIRAGYIKLKPSDIIDVKDVKNYAPDEVCIISTGSQGEPLAALSRIANGLNANISLSSEDTVVFASSPIPGNNYQIGKVIDQLYKTECKVIINTPHFKIHTSGHASKEEQKLMISLFKPEYFLPIHGNHFMLLQHQNTAISVGVKKENIHLLDNGDQIIFKKDQKPVINRGVAPRDSMYISGNNINTSLKKSNMNQLATDGMLIVSLLVGKNSKLVSYPQITTRGFIIINEQIDLLKQIQKFFLKTYNDNLHLNRLELEEVLVDNLKRYIYSKTQKNPFVNMNIINYNPQENKKEYSKSENN